MSKRFHAILILSASTLCRLAFAGSAEPSRVPVQAELVKGMEAGRIKVGETIFAKVDVEWKNSACSLRKGAILKGRVVSENARTKTSNSSDLALLFDSGRGHHSA